MRLRLEQPRRLWRGEELLMKLRRACLLLTLLFTSGCDGVQNALNPAGPQAGRIAGLSWFMLITMSAIYIIVVGALLFALYRSRRREPNLEVHDHQLARVVVVAVGATATFLVALFVLDLMTNRALNALERDDVFTIELTGRQWWWDIAYGDTTSGVYCRTANELHIPVGRTIRLRLASSDVIHSFWVPNLHGKRDLFPDHPSEIFLRADTAGIYRGQCAEFCGQQHANMALLVVAQEQAEFRSWFAQQQQPAAVPTDSLLLAGQRVFEQASCALCHTIRGTTARGTVAPDLTHFASRRELGAGVARNTKGQLGGWVLNPHVLKPHVYMPATPLGPEQLEALLAYLESLR